MEHDLENKLDMIKDNTDHYLVKAKSINHEYYNEFLQASEDLESHLQEKDRFERWYKEKMLINGQSFNEKQFIEFAVETSVVRFFGGKFPKEFKIDAEINPTNNMDVDCQFIDGVFKYNVEVKCSNFVSKEESENKTENLLKTYGRLDNREDFFNSINTVMPIAQVKNMDNNLKCFLKLAHNKFNPEPNENEVNVLVVGCDNADDIQSWYGYLWGNKGLFTEQSFCDRAEYKNVDLVVFTNLYFKHNKFYEKNVFDSWSLEKSFNYITSNPNRLLGKKEAVRNFFNIVPNYSKEISEYNVPREEFPEQFYSNANNSARIRWFIIDELEKKQGIYLFSRPN